MLGLFRKPVPTPRSFSLHFIAALALLYRSAGERQFQRVAWGSGSPGLIPGYAVVSLANVTSMLFLAFTGVRLWPVSCWLNHVDPRWEVLLWSAFLEGTEKIHMFDLPPVRAINSDSKSKARQ